MTLLKDKTKYKSKYAPNLRLLFIFCGFLLKSIIVIALPFTFHDNISSFRQRNISCPFSRKGFNIEAVFSMTTRGNRKLIHNGYTYTHYKDSVSNDVQTWRCNKSRWAQCKGRAKTTEINGKRMMKIIGEHNHFPDSLDM